MKPTSSLLGFVLAASSLVSLQADPMFLDDFESASLNPFWSVVQANGTISLSTANKHSGQQSAAFTHTAGGQLTLQLNHNFSAPQYGAASVWFYDEAMNYGYYSYLVIKNSASGKDSSFGVQDWDAQHYYYKPLNSASGCVAAINRSAGWHQFAMSLTPTNQTILLDGQLIFSGTNNLGFDGITLHASGPGGSRPYYFDDFNFVPAPVTVPIQISVLTGNGSLTWTNIPSLSNALFSVEWSPNLASGWRKTWGNLGGLMATSLTTIVDVPMFFRVKAQPSPLLPLPVDYQMSLFVSNAVGNVSTQLIAVLDYVRPRASTNEYVLLEQNNFNAGFMLMRSTATAAYSYSAATGVENLEFQLGAVGTSWTNLNYGGSGYDCKVTIEAIESITVPAGTFPCYKFHKQSIGVADSDRYEWISPGIGYIKWMDYWVSYTANPPIVYQLQSIGPRSP